MSYTLSISGHADSKKGEAEVLAAAADMAESLGAAASGSFSFSGMHFNVSVAPAGDGIAKARGLVEAYNAEADADDQAGAG